MHTSNQHAQDHRHLEAGLRVLEIGLPLLLLGYLFRGALEFAAWTLEFLWS